jgi:DNA ligase-1
MKRLAATLDAVRQTRSKKQKVELLAALWTQLDEAALAIASRLVLGQLLHTGEPRTLGIGWAIVAGAATTLTRHSVQALGLKIRELGDFGDALAELLPPVDSSLPLRELPAALDALASTDDRVEKQRLLTALLARCSPAEARYLGKALLGELRVGVQRGLFEESLAKAFDVPLEVLRKAAALTADPGDLAVLTKQGRLADAQIHVGTVVAFMLATPAEEVKQPLDPALTVMEDKLDGVRTQAHRSKAGVRLFSRGQGEVTQAFPEVVEQLEVIPREVILDGEIIAVAEDGRVRPFQALQNRLGRVSVSAALRAEVGLRFVAYDCLYDEGPLLDLPWTERRARLVALPVKVNDATPMRTDLPVDPQLDDAFTAARARGNEGVMLKRVDAPYEAGKRGAAWRKVKRAFATLDVVITRAERGHGKRAGVLSDYTFAVWKGERLVEIGKAYSGLTDREIDELTQRLETLTIAREPHFQRIEPRIVLEVAFDGLQRSTRHDSGFALRFPRIARIRDDKQPGQADTLETVAALWQAQLDTGHREERETAQLTLFE